MNFFGKIIFWLVMMIQLRNILEKKNMPLKRKISLIFNDTAWIFPKEIRKN